MSIPDRSALETLAVELQVDIVEFAGILDESELDDDQELRRARISLLGTIDAKVDDKVISAENAQRYYSILGFPAEEMAGIRQHAESELGSDSKT